MKRLVCECGERLHRKDVVQQQYYIRPTGPCFVYLKYRCPRCRRLGEQYVLQEDWLPSALDVAPREGGRSAERALVAAQGPITEAEHVAARDELLHGNPLLSLRRWIKRKRSG
jgi:hypothetical protein